MCVCVCVCVEVCVLLKYLVSLRSFVFDRSIWFIIVIWKLIWLPFARTQIVGQWKVSFTAVIIFLGIRCFYFWFRTDKDDKESLFRAYKSDRSCHDIFYGSLTLWNNVFFAVNYEMIRFSHKTIWFCINSSTFSLPHRDKRLYIYIYIYMICYHYIFCGYMFYGYKGLCI